MINTKKNNRIIILLFLGVLMGAMDISIVGPAIPSISKTIAIEPRLTGWIFSIYILFNLIGISLFAKLSDIFGRRYIYIIAITIFTLGSLIVSLSDNFNILLTGRAIQGFGASGFLPVASAVIGDVFPPEKRGRMLGLIGAVFGIAFIIGPVFAGVILHFAHWNTLFLLNIPLAVIIIISSFKILPNIKISSNSKLDWKGIISLGLFLGLFTLGVNNINSNNFGQSIVSKNVLPFISSSLIFFILLIFFEKKSTNPIIKLQFFRNRQIVIVGIISLITGLVQATFVFIPTFAVGIFKVNPSTASFMLIPIVLATAIGSPIFGRMLDKFGSKKIISLGTILTLIGFFILFKTNSNKIVFYSAGVFIGLGLSVLSGSSLRYVMLNEVAPIDRAISQGMLTIFVSLGQITGAAVIGIIIASTNITLGLKQTFLFLSIIIFISFFFTFFLKNKTQEDLLINKNPIL